MAELTNVMNVDALYNAVPTEAQSTVVVQMGNMQLTKVADQNPWIDGPLTYTVTLRNIEDAGTGYPLTSIQFSDTIDISLSTLDTTSVTINGVPAVLGTDFNYVPATGLFTVSYPDELAPGDSVVIRFQVTKAQ